MNMYLISIKPRKQHNTGRLLYKHKSSFSFTVFVRKKSNCCSNLHKMSEICVVISNNFHLVLKDLLALNPLRSKIQPASFDSF